MIATLRSTSNNSLCFEKNSQIFRQLEDDVEAGSIPRTLPRNIRQRFEMFLLEHVQMKD